VLLAQAGMAALPDKLLAGTGTTREYTVKGAFIYNFALFVDWPPNAFASDSAPFVIGVLGKNPFGEALDKMQGQSIKGRKVVVRALSNAEEGADCQLVFISASERGRLHQILALLRKGHVLTVSDLEGFTDAGGMVNFVTIEDKVRFEINLKEARSAKLRISSQLLKLARDVIE
jgi:hypothetical protein